MKAIKGIFSLFLFLCFALIAQAEPVQWKISDGGNDHWYEAVLVPGGISWTNANSAAQARAGKWHLVTIASAEENDFVYNLVNDDPRFWDGPVSGNYNGPWIGAHRLSGMTYGWVTGETWSYSNWGPLEPFQGYDYVSLFGYRTNSAPYWNDVPNEYPSAQPQGYIVETDTDIVSGCVEIKGLPAVGRKVTLRQDSEPNQVTKTDIKGCYSFDSVQYDKPLSIIIQSNWSPMLVPTTFRAVSASRDSINIKWKYDATDVESFQLFRRNGLAGTWSLLVTADANTLTYVDTTAIGNNLTNTYYYYVKACNSSGCSSATQTVGVPFAVSGLIAIPSSGKISLTWSCKSTIETGFQIYRMTGACAESNPWELLGDAPANATAYNNTTVTSGVPYSYKVRAYYKSSKEPYSSGYGRFSNCQTATAP